MRNKKTSYEEELEVTAEFIFEQLRDGTSPETIYTIYLSAKKEGELPNLSDVDYHKCYESASADYAMYQEELKELYA